VLGMLFISMGIAGSFVAGVVLDTTRQYALFTKVGASLFSRSSERKKS
jgi:hypothetical protein